MLHRFKQFVALLEGGNLAYSDEHGEMRIADSISLKERQEHIGHINNIKDAISRHIGGSPVTPVGSAEHFLNPKRTDQEFKDAEKTKFGDMDFVVPSAAHKKIHSLGNMVGKISTGENGHTLVHANTSEGDENKSESAGVSTLWKHNKTGKIIQVDLSPIKHTGNQPSEDYIWYKRSHPDDMFPKDPSMPSTGGLASKIGLQAAARAFGGSVEVKSKPTRLNPSGVKTVRSGVALSIGGKTAPGARFRTREIGGGFHEELPAAGAERVLHPHKIGKMIFGETFDPKKTDTESLHGTIKAVKRHGTPEQQDKFVGEVVNSLYGDGAQIAARHDKEGGKEYDLSKKDPIIGVMRSYFPDHPSLEEENVKPIRDKYIARAAKTKK